MLRRLALLVGAAVVAFGGAFAMARAGSDGGGTPAARVTATATAAPARPAAPHVVALRTAAPLPAMRRRHPFRLATPTPRPPVTATVRPTVAPRTTVAPRVTTAPHPRVTPTRPRPTPTTIVEDPG